MIKTVCQVETFFILIGVNNIMKGLSTNIKYVYLLICSFLMGCHTSTKHEDYYIICFQTSSVQNCYIVRISNDTIRTSVGQRSMAFLRYVYDNNRIPLDSLYLDTIVESKMQIINKDKLTKLYGNLNTMTKEKIINDFYPGGSNDAWGVIIIAGNKQYAVEYPTSNRAIDNVVRDISDLSPIKLFERKYTVAYSLN